MRSFPHCLAWLAALLVAPAVLANPFETYGFGARGIALGGALTANAADYSASFYNPAMLTQKENVNFGFDFNWFQPQTTVVRTGSTKELDCTNCSPPGSTGWTLGTLFPLGGKVKNRVALGVGLYLPTQNLIRVQANDPNRPFWAMYHSAQERLGLYGGLGVKVVEQLSLGVGVQILADVLGRGADIEVDLFSKQVTRREVDIEIRTRAAPTAGLLFTPLSWLRFGLAYRHKLALDFRTPASVDLDGIGTLAFTVHGTGHFTPHTLSLGTSADLTPALTLSGDLTYARWSEAPSPYVTLDMNPSGEALKALGLEAALALNTPPSAPGYKDTLSGKLALEVRFSPVVTARMSGFYRPTPVPKQNASGTNILDSTAVGAGAGLGFAFTDPLEVFSQPILFDLGAQLHFLLARDASKAPTDAVPSYRYSGTVLGGSAALRYDF